MIALLGGLAIAFTLDLGRAYAQNESDNQQECHGSQMSRQSVIAVYYRAKDDGSLALVQVEDLWPIVKRCITDAPPKPIDQCPPHYCEGVVPGSGTKYCYRCN